MGEFILIPIFVVLGIIAFIFIIQIFRSIRIVPAQTVLIVERLGKYSKTLEAGFHILVPFIDVVRYQHSLKEQAIDVPRQTAITKDNVKIEIDGVLYFKVVDPVKASYGITNYAYATVQLAQTTMRSAIGLLNLDKTFEERDNLNAQILKEISDATEPWGVQIIRYEIQNINVPPTILNAMEYQMKAEREKRARIEKSLGEMESSINYSQGYMQKLIQDSEGEKQSFINKADGKAAEIRALGKATAESIRSLAKAVSSSAGEDAVMLQISQEYLNTLESIGKDDTSIILPLDISDVDKVLSNLNKYIKG
ncbi:stomatin-like protein [Spirochaetia bacterium 38H-sp]|uniref:Stomatin-like protein n=1 Tax=Rarispira pelagica TaxID=3141764 RepID=A0ABU9U909_9SPIR